MNKKKVSLQVDVFEGGVGAYGAEEVVDVCLEAQLADVEGLQGAVLLLHQPDQGLYHLQQNHLLKHKN